MICRDTCFFLDYIMIVCLCFKFHEIYIIYIFTRIIPYPSTSISLFLPYFGPSFREPRTSCQLPLRRVDARAPCRNGKRTTTHLQLLWKLVDFGLSSQAWWCRVSYVSLSFFYFNIVCVSFLPCLNQHIFLRQWNDFSDFMWDCLRERSDMWRGLWSESK